jgi:hypothetical protein
MALGQSRDVPALQNDVAALYARSANVRHLITATFYLFGIVFFLGVAFHSVDTRRQDWLTIVGQVPDKRSNALTGHLSE